METLSKTTLNQMANNSDFLPTVKCYRELLSVACVKFGCNIDEARERYGRLTNAEWSKIFTA